MLGRKFDAWFLLVFAIAALAELAISAFIDRLVDVIPNILIEGIHFALIALISLSAVALIRSFKSVVADFELSHCSGKVTAIVLAAGTIVLFGFGCMFQYIYEYEPPVPVKLENFVVAVDNSSSMGWPDRDPTNRRYDALVNFVRLLDESKRLGVYTFTSECKAALPLTQIVPEDIEKYVSEINKHREASGGTDADVALSKIMDDLEAAPPVDGSTIIIFLSDGDEISCTDVTLARIEKFGAIVHTISIFVNDIPATMRTLASSTGGSFYDLHDAGQLSDTLLDASGTVVQRGYLLTGFRGDLVENSSYKGFLRILFIGLLAALIRLAQYLLLRVEETGILFIIQSVLITVIAGVMVETLCQGKLDIIIVRAFLAGLISLIILVVMIRETQRRIAKIKHYGYKSKT